MKKLIIALVIIVVLALAGKISYAVLDAGEAADIANPKTISCSFLELSYPGNWEISDIDTSFKDSAYVIFNANGGAWYTISMQKPVNKPDILAGQRARKLKTRIGSDVKEAKFTEWGGLRGFGRNVEGNSMFGGEKGWVFVHQDEIVCLVVLAYYKNNFAKSVEPGFELIANSFKLILSEPKSELVPEPEFEPEPETPSQE